RHLRIVDGMSGGEGGAAVVPGRVVLQVETGQPALTGGEDLVLVDGPVLVGLKEDAVDVEVGYFLGGHFVEGARPHPSRRHPGIAGRTTIPDRYEEFVACLSQELEVAAVDVPGEHPEWSVGHHLTRTASCCEPVRGWRWSIGRAGGRSAGSGLPSSGRGRP